jgi:cell wall-associated NlpC family hydrolase
MTASLARIPGRALLAVLGTTAVSLVVVSVGAGAPPTIKDKEAQARSVEAKVQALGVQLGRITESYDGARYRLVEIRKSLVRNQASLQQAQAGYRVAERRAAARLVAIYEQGEPTTADALLGATSLSDMLDRMEAVDSATELDRQLVQRVSSLRRALRTREHALAVARLQQQQTVATLASQRKQITAGLARQNRLLSSIKSQVASMQAAERARQRRLLLEAQARLAAEQRARAAQARAAAERARQAKLAAAQKPAGPTTAVVTTTAPPPATTTTSTSAPTTATVPTTTAPPPTTTAAPPPTTVSTPPPTTVSTAPPATVGPGHPAAASIALHYLGVPYQWGGATPAGFDCSGLVMYVFAQLGVPLPHYAAAQYQMGSPVSRAELQPGDLVFFDSLNHVGIWLGGNQFVDAPQTGDVVKIETLSDWYAKNYVGARRI